MRETIEDYRVAKAATPNGLEKVVRDYVKDGWQPFGNMIAFRPYMNSTMMDCFNSENVFMQPMVKYARAED